eukprot:1508606-Rhodomonas_salina.2
MPSLSVLDPWCYCCSYFDFVRFGLFRSRFGHVRRMLTQRISLRACYALSGTDRRARDPQARRLMPALAISTDVIAGFCGETEAEHEETLDVMRRVKFEQVCVT